MVSESGSRRSQNSAGPTHQPERKPGAAWDLEMEEATTRGRRDRAGRGASEGHAGEDQSLHTLRRDRIQRSCSRARAPARGDRRAQDGAGRVVRAVEEQDAGARRDAGGDVGDLHPEAVFGAQGHGNQWPRLGDQAFVGGIHRVADQHLIPRLGQRAQDGVERGLGAGQAHHLVAHRSRARAGRCSGRQGPRRHPGSPRPLE
jgi:hypothetical protein